jgi:hypothetical protein
MKKKEIAWHGHNIIAFIWIQVKLQYKQFIFCYMLEIILPL